MIHQKRRHALLNELDDNAIVLVSTNPEKNRSGDVNYPFRVHSDFYYLTGFQEPEALAVFSKENYTIFLRPKDKIREIWDGKRLGIDDAPNTLKSNHAFSIDLLKEKLPQIILNNQVYFDTKTCQLDNDISRLLSNHQLKSLAPTLHEMRLIKDMLEINIMQKAANISIKAHQLAMQTIQPNMFEFEVQSIFDGYFTKNNAQHAYTPIIAGGENACILHYIENNKKLNKNDLILIDAGAEVDCYASDITRTFPVNGQFSRAQKQIYQIVLDAQINAINVIKPGVKINEPHKVATNIIKQGLINLGILKTGADLSQFYMHGTGHWLGLDVHDVGQYKKDDHHRKFVAGMITTVEPGIYIRKNDKISPIYHNIGIRIEDDVLVTTSGNTVLTKSLAKEINEIESLMS
ncbi:aminopeptidase P, Metallo peptidase, MEROPS family M24B [Candidatus Ruthia magnifica str. Cm (Calyptogena magnifica)]|uniref:Xaa-Pro aminopeptidase n=1 Tax=Ruthia magnifica subsp. Calyptogena magnifica TaxID=413404 RepID=A1AVF2_RUTMC|nr:aminopeptidase P N-terminal domain-containing protein [Candidatus Ruthturnera calyptogenae]ABL01909.1 aminopeptidase P, Metallo peptidase, MEROPS family M24B [Candidatus Ruthia magnifica str. Cm (Calyptogena magnifica)]